MCFWIWHEPVLGQCVLLILMTLTSNLIISLTTFWILPPVYKLCTFHVPILKHPGILRTFSPSKGCRWMRAVFCLCLTMIILLEISIRIFNAVVSPCLLHPYAVDHFLVPPPSRPISQSQDKRVPFTTYQLIRPKPLVSKWGIAYTGNHSVPICVSHQIWCYPPSTTWRCRFGFFLYRV